MSVIDAIRQDTDGLDVLIDGATKAELGPLARDGLRRESIVRLDAAQSAIERGFHDLPGMAEPDARAALEQLASALENAAEIVDVLWWLAPGDPGVD